MNNIFNFTGSLPSLPLFTFSRLLSRCLFVVLSSLLLFFNDFQLDEMDLFSLASQLSAQADQICARTRVEEFIGTLVDNY